MDAMPTSSGSDATFGGTHCTEEHQWTQGRQRIMPGRKAGEDHARSQCRRRTCRDARLAKTTPGRNARRNVRGRKAAFGRRQQSPLFAER